MGAVVIAAVLILNGALGFFGKRFSPSPIYQSPNSVFVLDIIRR
jgi:hypothetical protein